MFKPNQLIADVFVQEDLETGLLQTDFQITLIKNGTLSIIPVTLTAIAGPAGFYKVEFTPDSVGVWSLDIVRIGKKTRYQQTYKVLLLSNEILDEVVADHLIPGSVGDYINKTKKYTANGLILDPLTESYVVKEDDGVTNFETGKANPVERIPD
jgi:hypothetical protein